MRKIRFSALVIVILAIISYLCIGTIRKNKQQEIAVSVIVPVYNTEKYLKECMDSLVAQTLKNIEIICIDDSSTDSSYDILMSYAKKYPTVKVYKQAHAGVGAARNNGIAKAKGKYIGFVDSDDAINKHYFSELYRIAEKYQKEITATSNVYLLDNKEAIFKTGINNKARWLEKSHLIYENHGGCAQWNKIYRKDFLLSHQIKSIPYQSKIEDCYFTTLALMNTDEVAVSPLSIYYYRIKADPKIKPPHITDFNRIYLYKDIFKYLESSDLPEAKKQLWRDLVTQAMQKNLNEELVLIESAQDRQSFIDLYYKVFTPNTQETLK